MVTAVESNEDKCKLLWDTFFSELKRDDTSHANIVYPNPKFKFHRVTNKQIHRATIRLGPFKHLDWMVYPTSCLSDVLTCLYLT